MSRCMAIGVIDGHCIFRAPFADCQGSFYRNTFKNLTFLEAIENALPQFNPDGIEGLQHIFDGQRLTNIAHY